MAIAIIVQLTAISARAGPHWALQPQFGIGVNIWAPAWYSESITRFDAEKLADSLHRAGATVAFTFQGFSQDHQGMSFFPTELGPMHPNLKGRDFIAEYIAACHRRGLTPEGLKPYKVLVLADAAVLSDAHLATIRQFVRDGGALVSTGRTSLIEQTGVRRKNFGLADVFGADYAGAHEPGYAFIQTDAQPLGSGIDPRERIPIRKAFQERITARPEAKRAARLALPVAEAAFPTRTFALGPNDVPPAILPTPRRWWRPNSAAGVPFILRRTSPVCMENMDIIRSAGCW